MEAVSQRDILFFIGCLPGVVAASHMTVRYMDSMVFVSVGLVSLFVVTVDLVSSAVVHSTILAVVTAVPRWLWLSSAICWNLWFPVIRSVRRRPVLCLKG